MDNKTAEELKPYASTIDNLLLALPIGEVPEFIKALAERYYNETVAKNEKMLAGGILLGFVELEREEDGVTIHRNMMAGGNTTICAGMITEMTDKLPDHVAILARQSAPDQEFNYLAALLVDSLERKLNSLKEKVQQAEAE